MSVLATLLVVVLALGGVFFLISPDSAAAAVLLEPIDEPGPDAFTTPVAPEPAGSLRDYADQGASALALTAPSDDPAESPEDPNGVADPDEPGAVEASAATYQVADGATPGLYGGTQDDAACDPEQLIAFLLDDDDKAQAWAGVLDLEAADIPAYIGGLTAVNLGEDTRVTNHGFADGVATPREAVLQRGSAVMVDADGVARVRCYCGNPLLEPAVAEIEEFEGQMWSSFDPNQVRLVDRAAAPMEEFELFDVATGDRFFRPRGSTGNRDRPVVPEPEPAPDPEPEPAPDPEPEPEPEPEPDSTRSDEEFCGLIQERPFAGAELDADVYAGPGSTLSCDQAQEVGRGYFDAFVRSIQAGEFPADGSLVPADFDGWSCRGGEGDTAIVCEGEPGPVILREPGT